MEKVIDAAVRDAEALVRAGVDAIMLENYGDVPFPRGPAVAETVAALTTAAVAVVRVVDLPLGINVLRNDGRAALGVALAVGARFIRVNLLAWARLTDQGLIEGDAATLQRVRAAIGAMNIAVLADVAVKHSAPVAPVDLLDEAGDLVERALADAVIVTGKATSAPVDANDLVSLRGVLEAPVIVGSGVTLDNVGDLAPLADGAIVGSAMMEDGRPGGRVELQRAEALVRAWRAARR